MPSKLLNQIQSHLNKIYNSRLKFTFEVIHELVKGYPIFQIKAHQTYPELNGGQIRCARGLSVPNRYMNIVVQYLSF